jgi:hypothetical protein
LPEASWLRERIESDATNFAVANLVPRHLADVKVRKENLVDKTVEAVKARLTAEINYWDHRAEQLKEQELAGKSNAKINSGKARQRADELTSRLQKRMDELAQERRVSPLPPNVIGGAMIVPIGAIWRLQGASRSPDTFAKETARVETAAMKAVMAAERSLGFEPSDVSANKCGYDVESRVPGQEGHLRFIEVKGRAKGADTVTVTKNEILTALNKPEQFILAVVEVDGDIAKPCYVRQPFSREPDFGVTSVNYKLSELVARGRPPG